jgi:integral membrane sensor domain MASE1
MYSWGLNYLQFFNDFCEFVELQTKEHCFVAFRLMAYTTFSLNLLLKMGSYTIRFLMHLFVMWTVNMNEETYYVDINVDR